MLWMLITFGIPLAITAGIIWWKRRLSLTAIMLIIALTAALLALLRARLGF